MQKLRSPVVFVFLSLLMLVATPLAASADIVEYAQHVRTNDPYLHQLIRQGIVTSPTLRKLVAHLQASDVVVYLIRDRNLKPTIQGKTTFKGMAGGVRYLQVSVGWSLMPTFQIATLAHELQHATEIADAPWVVDEQSLAREYGRIGYDSPALASPPSRAFESAEAVAVGQRVWREFVSKSADD